MANNSYFKSLKNVLSSFKTGLEDTRREQIRDGAMIQGEASSKDIELLNEGTALQKMKLDSLASYKALKTKYMKLFKPKNFDIQDTSLKEYLLQTCRGMLKETVVSNDNPSKENSYTNPYNHFNLMMIKFELRGEDDGVQTPAGLDQKTMAQAFRMICTQENIKLSENQQQALKEFDANKTFQDECCELLFEIIQTPVKTLEQLPSLQEQQNPETAVNGAYAMEKSTRDITSEPQLIQSTETVVDDCKAETDKVNTTSSPQLSDEESKTIQAQRAQLESIKKIEQRQFKDSSLEQSRYRLSKAFKEIKKALNETGSVEESEPTGQSID